MWLDCSGGVTSAKFLSAIERSLPEGRFWSEVQRFLESMSARDHAFAVYEVLAQAEAEAHGVPREQVHFHEVGRLDNLARVRGIFCALDMLGIEKWYASPPPLGNGTITCSHGELSVPAPATRRIVETYAIPTTPVPDEPVVGELTTPTGVALLTRATGFLEAPPHGALILKTE